MSVLASASPAAHYSPARLIGLIGLTLALCYLVVLAGAYLGGHFLVDAQGRPIAGDFVNVWAAGQLALDGHPALAYDWTVHKSMEVRAVGHAFDNYYGWHYPPTFLFVAAGVALVPFLPASVLWIAATLPVFAVAVRAIAGSRAGFLLALGFPATLWNVAAGQNGFLTAALIGGTLGLLERHPTLAGICLGLLSYKPHFGLLFPVALLAGRQWRAIGVAATVALVMAALSWFAFGNETWIAFFRGMTTTGQAVLGDGRADWDRLQSLFGLVRAQGGLEMLAWAVQAAALAALAAAIYKLWQSRMAFELKAAALATGVLLATPYLYIYDLVVLAVPVAYLVRLGLGQGFTLAERVGLPAAGVLLLIYPYLKTQSGLAATLIVAGLLAQRVVMATRRGG